MKEKVKQEAKGKDKSPKKKADLSKFFGILKLEEDPVTLQRKWRDEWN